MKLSDFGYRLLRKWEGCRLKAYRCEAGVLTIGYGHTGDDVVEGLKISDAQADALLMQDVAYVEAGVLKALADTKVSQGQFDALVCFAFNVGLGALSRSSLLKLTKAALRKAAAEEFAKWAKVRNPKSKELVLSKGLASRRADERALYLS